MNLSKNEDLKDILRTFAVLNKDGILTSEDDTEETVSESEYDTDSSRENTTTNLSFQLPRVTSSQPALRFPVVLPNPDLYYSAWCDQYIDFTNKNPTTVHVIDHFKSVLENNGFKYLPEGSPFPDDAIRSGGQFFTVRGGLSLVAFVLGGSWTPQNGIGAIGSHVDSLAVKLKPTSVKKTKYGYQLLGVAPYSGTLNKLWCDRDLGIGGEILYKNEKGKIARKLVSSSPYPVAKIPTLAEHFGLVAEKTYNKETEMVPIVGYGTDNQEALEQEKKAPLYGKHPIALLRYISKLAEVDIGEIVQLDLDLFDVQPAVRGGIDKEFLFAPRIDDRLCSFAAICSLIRHGQNFLSNPDEDALKKHAGFNLVYLTNHEEVGSGSRTGAKGKLLNSVVKRVLSLKEEGQNLELTFANSAILSADVTHALNPNFKEVYLEKTFPVPNTGLTVKMDPNAHVMTDTTGLQLLGEIAAKNHQKLQQFQIRNDSRSGGTIGPMLATDTGALVIDVGLPQLAMHSIRGTAGYKEAGLGVKIFTAFFDDWRKVLDKIDVDKPRLQ